MTEELVTFETAKLAKAKGFDEECMNYWEWYEYEGKEYGPIAHAKPVFDFREVDRKMFEAGLERPALYNKIYWPMKNADTNQWLYARPSQDLLERWLREKWDTHIVIIFSTGRTYVSYLKGERVSSSNCWGRYRIRPVAREAALQHGLKLLPDAC